MSKLPYAALLIFLFLAHILGDYYFQPNRLAAAKGKKRGALLLHCLLYGAAYCIVLFPVFSFPAVLWFLLLPLSHAAIDYAKQGLTASGRPLSAERLIKPEHEKGAVEKLNLWIFIVDQALHLLLIALGAWLMARSNILTTSYLGYRLFMRFIFGGLGIGPRQLMWLFTLLLFLGKPCMVIVQNALAPIRAFAAGDTAGGDSRGGRVIGVLERILIAIFILLGQWGALGFTLAAKTLTRYNKIVEDKAFGEQYLIGTLLSVTLTIIAVMALKLLP